MTCQCRDKPHAEAVQAVYELDILIRRLLVTSLESSSVEGRKRGYTWERIRDTTRCVFNHVHCDKASEFYDSIKPPGVLSSRARDTTATTMVEGKRYQSSSWVGGSYVEAVPPS